MFSPVPIESPFVPKVEQIKRLKAPKSSATC